jgi:O-antigen/teichoic acid export membrane protein
LSQDSILRRAGPLMAARIAVAAVTFAPPLVLARVLSPAEYGTFKLAWLWCTTLGLVVPLGITGSLMYFVPHEPKRAGVYISHALLFTNIVGLAAGAFLYFAGPVLARSIGNPELAAHMPWVAAFTALFVGGNAMDSIPLSQGRIKLAAVLRFGYAGTQAIGIAVGALLTHSVAGTFAGIVLATGLRTVACWWMVLSESGFSISRAHLKRQLAYALPFGLAFAVIIPQQRFHQYFVSACVSPALFAVYAVGCFELPIIDMLYTPISEVMQLGIAEHDRAGDRLGPRRLFHEAVSRLAFAFIPAMALLWVCSPQLIRVLFTDRYLAAVPIFRVAILSVPLAALPLDGVMKARAENRFMLAVSVVKLLLTVGAVVGGFHLAGMVGAISGWVAAEALSRGILLVRTGMLLGSVRNVLPWRVLLLQSLASLVAVPAAVLARRAVSARPILELIASAAAFGATYLLALGFAGELPSVRDLMPRRRSARVAAS